MKTIKLAILFVLFSFTQSFAQTAYNPFTQNIHFAPEPTVFGFECGTTQTVVFDQGLTTSADATQWQTNPLTVTICVSGFQLIGSASSIVSGSYAANFNWAYAVGSSNCLIGTQKQILAGTGSDPIFPNPASSGPINVSLKVPENSPVGTVLSVNVTLQVPAYMSLFNSIPDDNESTQTQTFCSCYALTDPGAIAGNQTFCGSGNPVAFTNSSSASGGSGSTLIYQWQELIGSTWTDISGATGATFDAPNLTTTTQYRRNAKRQACGAWLSTLPLTITINPLPVANAGVDKSLNCTTPSTTIGTTAVAGNTYAWSPATSLSTTNSATPTTNASSTLTYTVTVTNASGCTATDAVLVTVNKGLPTVNAGLDKILTCSTTSTTIGTTALAGNTYSWANATGLSAINIAQPTANPTVTTNYTVTVTGSNGCSATDVVIVNVNQISTELLPTVTAVSCNSNGTESVSTDDYITFLLNPGLYPTLTGNKYTVTATQGGSPISVTLSDGTPATNLFFGYSSPLKTASGTAGNGNIVLTLTAINASTGCVSIKNVTIADPGSCIVPAGTCVSGTMTFKYRTPYLTTNLSQVPLSVPKFDNQGGSRTLTSTSVSYSITRDHIVVAENTSSGPVTADFTLTGNGSITLGTSTIFNSNFTNFATGTQNFAAPVLVPVGANSSFWPGDSIAGLSQSTLNRSLKLGLDDYLSGINVDPTLSSAWVTNITGLSTSDDDMRYFTSNETISGSNNFTNATDLAQFVGTGLVDLKANTNVQGTFNGTGGNWVTLQKTKAYAEVTVSYTYSAVPPIADAGPDKNLTCSLTSATIGTPSISGNTYSWANSSGLSASNMAQPIASPSTTTNYTVTVTSANGCTATDVVTVNVNKTLPVVDAGVDKNLNCTTTSTTIGSTAVAGNTYSWSPITALSSASSANPTANPTVTTTYTVTVTGSNGCTATDVVVVNVNTTLPTANAGLDKINTCTNTTSIIGTTNISGNTYSWTPSTGLSSTTIAQPTANPTGTTTYTVTVTGSNGCIATDAVVVTVDKANPTADAGVDKNLNCTTTSTTIGTASITGSTYSWSPTNNLSSSTIAQPTANPSATTTYTVTVTGSNGCTSTDAVVINVNTTLPVVSAGVDKDLNCTTTSTTIGSTAVAGNTYSWSPITALSSASSANPTANPTVTTTYTVTVTGSNGCTATDVVTVNVNTTLPTANAGVDKTTTCLNTSAVIGSLAVAGNTYSWSPSSGLSSTSVAQPTANPIGTTTYTVTVTGVNGCTSTDEVVVTVDKTNPSADAGADKTLNCTTTSTTIGSTTVAGNTYVWSPSTGLSSTTISNPISSTTSTRTYTVTVTGSNGCSATDAVLVTVNTAPPVANAGSNKTICKDSSIAIGTTAIAGNTYSWNPSATLSASNIAMPVASPLNTTIYTVTVTGSNGCIATSVVTVTVNICVVNVSGNVYNDVNGLTNTNVDGIGIGLPSGTPLYASLIDGSGNVVNSVSINSNGTYQFLNVPVNTNYTMVLSTIQGIAGNQAPSPSLPNDWMNIGEDCCDNAGSDGLVNGITSLSVGTTDVPNVNFGIQQPPTPGTNTQPNQVNPGGTVCVSVPSNAWSGTDPSGGTISSLTITSFPSNATSITINGINYTATNFPNGGVTIPTNTQGQSTQAICVDPVSGSVTVNIPYEVTDNAGATSTSLGSVQLPFGTINISGNVYVDNNGTTNVDGTGIGSPSSIQLYANLIDASGNVVKITPINANGTYQFLDVTPNSTYTVVLSTTNGVIGSPAPAANLPIGWSNVSEDCCDDTGNDGITDGMTAVIVVTSNVPQVNFGIREPLSLGNIVWIDANRNGIKEASEVGIIGASVNLYLDANADGIPDGAAIQNTTTNSTGNYIFNGLNASSYLVGVTPPVISGSVYTSSTIGEELNPNLNIDNNDNGVNLVGNEVRSGVVTLLAGSEPLGELPNNTTTLDANANLTVDFGFFICPANFTFTPRYLCAGELLDLTTVEPVNYTGGVWTNALGNPISNTNVGKGTYTYTFTDGTCIASGSVTLSDNVPDYTPTIAIAPSAITGISNVRVILSISEILNRKSCTPIYVLIPRLEPRYAFTYQPSATTIGGVAVANADWQFFNTNPNFYIWKYVGNATFPANATSKFGYIGSYNPNDTDGETTFSVQIFQGSGGETNQQNNTDSETLIYFR